MFVKLGLMVGSIGVGLTGLVLGADATIPLDLGWAGTAGQASASVILIVTAGYTIKALITGDIVTIAKHKEELSEMKASIVANGNTASNGIDRLASAIDALHSKIDRLL